MNCRPFQLSSLLTVFIFASMLSSFALDIIGHRGASYDAPENTLNSIKLSFEQGADGTELDVHLTGDGKIAVFHDYDLKRMAGLPGKIAEMSLSDLQKHNVAEFGKWKGRGLTERIPELKDVFPLVPPGKRLFIEVKCHEEIIPALAEAVAQSRLQPKQLPIITFHYDVAKAIKEQLPKHEVSWLHSWSKDKPNPTAEELIGKAKGAGLDGLDLNYGFPIDKAFVQKVHAAGLKLYTWTVNDAAVARAERDAGVDGITTDRPAWLREQLSTAAEQNPSAGNGRVSAK